MSGFTAKMLLSYEYKGCVGLYTFDGITTFNYTLKVKECSWWGYGKTKIKYVDVSYPGKDNLEISKQLDSYINKWH